MAVSHPSSDQCGELQTHLHPAFSLTFRKPDRLKVITNCGNRPMRLIENTVLSAYLPGLTSVKVKRPDQAWTLKLQHSPFSRGAPSDDAVAARELACELLQAAWRTGWSLAAAPIVNNVRDASTWFFSRRPNADTVDADVDVSRYRCCCVMLTQSNGIRFVRYPPGLLESTAELIGSMWPAGVIQGASQDLRLSGSPWSAKKSEGTAARRLLLRLIEFVQHNGWQLLASARVKDSCDSFYFCSSGDPGNGGVGHPGALGLQGSHLMLLSLHDKQSVRLEGGTAESEGQWLAGTLNRLWHRGVQSSGSYYGSFDIRLAGSPWLPTDRDTKNYSRQLIGRLLGELRTRGWRVLHSLDTQRRIVVKSAFLFGRAPPEPAPVPHCCFWTSVPDRLSFIDLPESLLGSAIAVAHASGQVVSQKARSGAFELKFRGSRACGKLEWRRMLSDLLTEFLVSGWSLACTGNVSGRYYSDDSNSYSLEVHSWWFAQLSPMESKALEASAIGYSSEMGDKKLSPLQPPSYDSLFGT